MTDLPDCRFHFQQLVIVTLPDDTQPLGRIVGWEDGRQLDPRHGGPCIGWLYDVELDGHDGLERRTVRAGEEALEALTE